MKSSKAKGQKTLTEFISSPQANGYGLNGNQESKGPSPAKRASLNAIEQIYQKKSQLEHILLRPDTYIGSVEPVTEQMWVIDEGKMINREVTYVPGLYKIFDEILVNAADNKQRDKSMDCIKIDIDRESNTISVWNNGSGIPVVEHQKEKMMVPTLIFGHLLTSSNFNDEERKVTGGRNGFGAKLCNVFSSKFTVETASKKYKKHFKQVWENNMSKAGEPKTKDFSSNDFTKVTFKPDLSKFKMESLDNDIIAIFERRAYDVAASTGGVKVKLNGKDVPVKNFKDYIDLFLKGTTDEMGKEIKCTYEKVNDRWEIACAPSDNGFQQISFVNSIATTKGGRHVDYVTDIIVKNISDNVKKKNKNGIPIKPHQVKNHVWVFVNCLIENPTFDSQTKENMTLQAKNFGSKCNPSDKFLGSVAKAGIVESVLQWAKFKAESKLEKGSGKKTSKLKGIPKLEDANDAGTKHSSECTLILTEGDSAKTLAVAGLGVVGRDRYGVFPLRGKLLNVREASHKQIMDNAEITALVKILGLQYKKKYGTFDDMKSLRYGKLMIMTDQDQDGSHIKGLIINFIHHNWPSLLQMSFIEEFITPIVKVSKGNECHSFFSLPELEDFKKRTPNWKTYKIKYYKGLGTSTSKEAKEYFSDMRRHRIRFKYAGMSDDDKIKMAFSKKCIEERKTWLTTWMENTKKNKELGLEEDMLYMKGVTTISYTDFIDRELVLFSNMDNERSIPCMVDGLKPGQRKVIFACFKRKLEKKEIKVAQLAGSVAEISAYHHGEQSLMSTIINLAQNFVGSNNLNLLMPIGQFGTRLQGGKDSASPRYIFTKLNPLTRFIYKIEDESVLKYLYDDNLKIEPEWYCPIIPMVLVNGSDGIGTGWMTRIPNYDPRKIIKNLLCMINGSEPEPMKPWYKGFKGEILPIDSQKYACNGEVNLLSGSKIEITELPVGTWTQTYKESTIEPMLSGSEKNPSTISDYKEYHTDTTVRFVVSMKDETLQKFESEGLHKVFKLQTAMNLTSMVLFDKNGCLKKYNSAEEILKEFYELRLEMYQKRKDFLLGMLEAEALKLKNQARFIVEKCDGKFIVENRKIKIIIQEFISRKYDSDPVAAWQAKQADHVIATEEDEDQQDKSSNELESGKDFRYLYTMSIQSLSLEKKEKLLKEKDEKVKAVEDLRKKTIYDLYKEDLQALLSKMEEVDKEESEGDTTTKRKMLGKKNFSKKAELDVLPSPQGKRVAPTIDEMIKKAELAVKAKEKRGAKKAKLQEQDIAIKEEGKDEFERMSKEDEFDKMVQEDDDSPFSKRKKPISRAKINDVGMDKRKGRGKKVKNKKGSLSDSELSSGSGSAEGGDLFSKIRKNAGYDKDESDDDFRIVKKQKLSKPKQGRKKIVDDSDSDDDIIMDSVSNNSFSPIRRNQRSKAQPAKYFFDGDEDSELSSG